MLASRIGIHAERRFLTPPLSVANEYFTVLFHPESPLFREERSPRGSRYTRNDDKRLLRVVMVIEAFLEKTNDKNHTTFQSGLSHPGTCFWLRVRAQLLPESGCSAPKTQVA
jgi:hypothetical protein